MWVYENRGLGFRVEGLGFRENRTSFEVGVLGVSIRTSDIHIRWSAQRVAQQYSCNYYSSCIGTQTTNAKLLNPQSPSSPKPFITALGHGIQQDPFAVSGWQLQRHVLGEGPG